MNRLFLIVNYILLASIIFIGCDDIKTPEPKNIQDVVITLERTACFGTCPIYQLTVYGNGLVVYEGIRFVRVEGKRTTIIDEERVRQLVNEFRRIDYFSMENSYEELHATDMPSVISSITIDGRTKAIRHYHGDRNAPKKLTELENRIDEIINSGQWVDQYTQ